MVCSQTLATVARRGDDQPSRKQQRVEQAAACAKRFGTGTKASRPQSGCASVNAANGSQDLRSLDDGWNAGRRGQDQSHLQRLVIQRTTLLKLPENIACYLKYPEGRFGS